MTVATHILTSTDFSNTSDFGVREAAKLAKLTGAKVTLVHVFEPGPPMVADGVGVSGSLGNDNEIITAARRSLERVRDKDLRGVDNVEIELLQGSSASATLCEYAEKNGIDMIVLSTHGRTGLAHLLIGSVAERVVRHASCAVMTIRAPEE